MSTFSKRNKTFRLDPSIITLIEGAAALGGLAEADIVARCVLAQVQPVLKRTLITRQAMKHPQVVQALAEFADRAETAGAKPHLH